MSELIEWNIEIAKFMCVKIVDRNNFPAVFMYEDAAFPEYFEFTRFNTYNEDWNMLMEVVDRIENMNIDKLLPSYSSLTLRIYSKYYARFESIESQSLHFPDVFGETKIEAVFKAVTKFIEWYKTTNPTGDNN